MSNEHMQIGEVAERTSLSLRTIRYYEEVGLVLPSARSHGGFRLYTDADVERLLLVKRMKPLEFTLDEMRDLLAILDALTPGHGTAAQRDELRDRLSMYSSVAEQRIDALRSQLDTAQEFVQQLHEQQHSARPAGGGRRRR
jgi:MerR family copper efflux transcriptional regulator